MIILCKKTFKKIVSPYFHFIFINENNINLKNILNILVEKTKDIFSNEFICKVEKDDYLTTKRKYIFEIFQIFYL